MGLFIDEASRRRQIANATHKTKLAAAKIGQCIHKLLDTSAKKKNEVEITRLFLEGIAEFVLYTGVRQELTYDAGKADLAAFIKKEYEKIGFHPASKRPK
jgi:hypothetical protein